MADMTGNLLNMLMQMKQIEVQRQNADTQAQSVANQGHVDASSVMQGFMTALSHTNKENRPDIVKAFAQSTGADPDLLSKVAESIQDSPELIRQRAANDLYNSGAITTADAGTAPLTGQTQTGNAEDRMMSELVRTRGASQGQEGIAAYHGMIAKHVSGMDPGELAASLAKATLPTSTLQQGATNAMGTTMTAEQSAMLPIQQMMANTGQYNAITGRQGMDNSLTLGLGNLQLGTNSLAENTQTRLMTAALGHAQAQQGAIEEVRKLTEQLQHPMTAGAAAVIQAALNQARVRAGLLFQVPAPGSAPGAPLTPLPQVAPQSFFGGVGYGASGAVK